MSVRMSMWAVLSVSSAAVAQVDNLQVLVTTGDATGGNAISSAAYDAGSDTAYVTSFGAGGALRRITGVSTPTPVSQIMVSEGQLQLFYRDGDPTRSVSTPLQSGLIFNPVPVGAIPAFGSLWISDNGFTRFPSPSTATDPDATKRVYRYNLQAPPVGGDGRDVFTTQVTLSHLRNASGGGTASDNFGRQMAFSPDGQSIYAADSSVAHGGIYRIDAEMGAIARLHVGRINTEPAVLQVGSADRVLFAGTAASSNDGGISYVDVNGTMASAEQVLISSATLTDFLDRPTPVTADVRAMTTDDAGNVYFNDIGTSTLIRLDPQGRLSKVTTRNERDLAFTGEVGSAPTPNSNNLRLQTYQYAHPTAGSITRVVYVESTPLNFVAAADAFNPIDFNRDGSADAADIALFKAKLGTRGAASSIADARYDLNGSGSIDWKDVKILQSFAPTIRDGDANMDGTVDFTDLNTLRDNYLGTGKTWLEGDFASLLAGSNVYLPTAADVNVVDYVDLQTLANTWLNVLGQPAPTETELDANGYAGQFRSDVIAAFNIPEPVTIGLLPLVGLMMGRRRSR